MHNRFAGPSVLVGRQEGHLACKKTEWWWVGMVICLEQGADLHTAQLMPLPLTVSCFSKIQIGFTFLVLAHLGRPGERAVKRVCCETLGMCVLCQSECSSSSSVSCSPRHSLPRSLGVAAEPAAVVVVESAFSRLHVQTSHTTHVQNYDHSEVTTTSTRHKDGIETVSEVTAWPDGRVDVHELVRNMASGKTSKHPAVAAFN